MAKLLRFLFQLLFMLALPLALVLSSLRWFVFDPANYLRLQDGLAVARLNGLSHTELEVIDRALVRYFQSPDRDSFARSMEAEGVVRSPFSERDVAHLRDVHNLIRLAMNVQFVAVAYALVFLIAAAMARARRPAGRAVAAGSALTVVAFAALAVLSLLDWDQLFLRFHVISFSNDLWRLDPAQDALIRLYPPPGFYLQATLQIVSLSIVEALVLGGLALLLLRCDKRLARAK